MPFSLSQEWHHDPALDAIMFEGGTSQAAPEQMGIKIEALAEISRITSAPPEAMGQLYLENRDQIANIAERVLNDGRRRHKGVTMLFSDDFTIAVRDEQSGHYERHEHGI